jgi:ectoine hydroxylase-related dioxygenase (phytanoyl-CoA dioxygenase family)
VSRFDRDGYAIAELVLTASACEIVARELPPIAAGRGGVRSLIDAPTVTRLIRSQELARAARDFVDGPLVAVKATLFDKTPRSNWRAQWHQDRIIAVKERRDVEGYGPWREKEGVLHVEPPARVLEQMVAVRVHLDDCGADNGALRVIPGSHREGKLAPEQIASMLKTRPQLLLAMPQGSIAFMRPLLVHASSPSDAPVHRRVLHIELAPREIIAPLEWHDAMPLG